MRFLVERDTFTAAFNVVDSENGFKPITDKTMPSTHAVSLAKRMNNTPAGIESYEGII